SMREREIRDHLVVTPRFYQLLDLLAVVEQGHGPALVVGVSTTKSVSLSTWEWGRKSPCRKCHSQRGHAPSRLTDLRRRQGQAPVGTSRGLMLDGRAGSACPGRWGRGRAAEPGGSCSGGEDHGATTRDGGGRSAAGAAGPGGGGTGRRGRGR